jgi:hypothetical protein
LCELKLVGLSPLGELGRRTPAEGSVGTVRVVLLAPVCDKDLGLAQAVELLDREQLVSDESRRNGPRVLPWTPGLDVVDAGLG